MPFDQTPEDDPTIRLLDIAQDKLRTGWVQRVSHKVNPDGSMSRCLEAALTEGSQAIRACAPLFAGRMPDWLRAYNEAYGLLLDEIRHMPGSHVRSRLAEYNDLPTTTQSDVLALCERAKQARRERLRV